MENISQDSLNWLGDLNDLSKQARKDPTKSNTDLAKELGIHRGSVITLKVLITLLDPSAIEKIQKAARGKYPYTLSFRQATALARLEGGITGKPGIVHETLDMAIARRLTTKEILGLVAHVKSGKPAKEFDRTQVKRKTRSDKKVRIPRNQRQGVSGGESGTSIGQPGEREEETQYPEWVLKIRAFLEKLDKWEQSDPVDRFIEKHAGLLFFILLVLIFASCRVTHCGKSQQPEAQPPAAVSTPAQDTKP